jgi:CBS domain-containing protein
MIPEFISGAAFTKYGTTLYVGIGIPIPILNEGLAKKTAIRDEETFTDIIDYGVPRRERPKLGKVSYKDLKSGTITINERKVSVSPLSSLKEAKIISETLKSWIENGLFYLTSPVERLPTDTVAKPMKQTEDIAFVNNVIQTAVTCTEDDEIRAVAEKIISRSVNHIIVVDKEGRISGIVTSWDITKSVAEGKRKVSDIITRKVVTTIPDEPLEAASRKMAQHHISALPVIDHSRKVLGIVTSEDISKLLGR